MKSIQLLLLFTLPTLEPALFLGLAVLGILLLSVFSWSFLSSSLVNIMLLVYVGSILILALYMSTFNLNLGGLKGSLLTLGFSGVCLFLLPKEGAATQNSNLLFNITGAESLVYLFLSGLMMFSLFFSFYLASAKNFKPTSSFLWK